MSIYLPSTGGFPPYWGPQTSHMNFCEEDYHVTSYIGEFINTLTSLFYAYLGFKGIAAVAARRELSFLSVLPYVAIVILGAASALFHGTLKYPMQLRMFAIYRCSVPAWLFTSNSYHNFNSCSNELPKYQLPHVPNYSSTLTVLNLCSFCSFLPRLYSNHDRYPITDTPSPNREATAHTVDDNTMLFGAAIMLHRLFAHHLSPSPSILIFAILNLLVCGVIYAHIALGESTLHHVVFAGMMITSAVRTSRLITTTVKDKALKRQMRVVGLWALGMMIGAYALWNVDNVFCERLRSVRGRIGLPWAWLLELHGWWHILTGQAVYLHTLLAECLCPWGQSEPIPLGDRIPRLPLVLITTREDIKRHGEKKRD